MNEVVKFIKLQKKPCFLLCKKKLVKFYKKYGFKKLDKKKYKLEDHKNRLHGMTYNLNKADLIKMKKFHYNI